MNFNSLSFLIFLVVVLILYWVLPHRFRWIMLLAASYYFYMSWNVWLIFLIVGTTIISYLTAILISGTEKKGMKRFWLALALIVCLGALIFFKYFNFLLKSAIDFLNLFSLHLDGIALDLILPVGISFYTFQTLSYVIDVYRGTIAPERHFGYYALFVCYFPQLVAGPIERPKDLIPQLKTEQKFSFDKAEAGFRLMLTGFFRKCVIADFCGIFVANVYADIANATSLAVFAVGILFIMQIYNDFAGYSEIASGVALMMGVKLTKNFDKPFTALSLTEFFRRWHITLNRWFVDYVYIPLGGSRKGTFRTALNTLVVFALSGLWHGANWTYVLWGLMSGVVVMCEMLWKRVFAKGRNARHSELVNGFKRIGLLCFFAVTAILFRAENLAQYGQLLQRLLTGFPSDYFAATFESLGMTAMSFLQLILVFVCMNFICAFGEFRQNDPASLRKNAAAEHAAYVQRASVYVYIILVIALCWIAVLNLGDPSAFLYFQF